MIGFCAVDLASSDNALARSQDHPRTAHYSTLLYHKTCYQQRVVFDTSSEWNVDGMDGSVGRWIGGSVGRWVGGSMDRWVDVSVDQ